MYVSFLSFPSPFNLFPLPPPLPCQIPTKDNDGGYADVMDRIDYSSHRRRNPRFYGPRRENERFVRQYESEVTRDHEQDAEDGGEDGGRMEGVVGFFRGGDFLVLVCLVVLKKNQKERRRRRKEERGFLMFLKRCLFGEGGYVIKGFVWTVKMGTELGRRCWVLLVPALYMTG